MPNQLDVIGDKTAQRINVLMREALMTLDEERELDGIRGDTDYLSLVVKFNLAALQVAIGEVIAENNKALIAYVEDLRRK